MSAETNTALSLHADEELFEFVENENGWWLHYTGGGDASLEIGFAFIPPEGVEELASRFLDNYLDGGESESVGEQRIGRSSLRGLYVSGETNGETYEAWLHSLSEYDVFDMIVVFVINYRDNAQKAALHAIIDTFEMIQIEEP